MIKKFSDERVRSRTKEVAKYNPQLDTDKYLCELVMVVPVKPIEDYVVNEPCLLLGFSRGDRALKTDGSLGQPLSNKDRCLRYATDAEISRFFDELDEDQAINTLYGIK